MTKRKATGKKRAKKGPEPERLKIQGDWTKAVDSALKVKRPKGGWPGSAGF